MLKLLLLLAVSQVLSAQTTFYMVGETYRCASPLACASEPFVAPEGEPMYYPYAWATYTTGLPELPFYRPGTEPQAPAIGTGTGPSTFVWSDGGPNSGTLTLGPMTCVIIGARPTYTITCDGQDGHGNKAHLVHHLYLAEERYGYWNWFDVGSTLTLTLAATL